MKRFLAILIGATSCSLCTYAQNGYIVTTTSQQTSISVESLEKQFINDHFKYYNLCDWTPGMKLWGIERSGFFNGREKWAKGFENQRV